MNAAHQVRTEIACMNWMQFVEELLFFLQIKLSGEVFVVEVAILQM